MDIKTKLLSFIACALLITLAMPAHAVYSWSYTGNGSVCSGNCASKVNNNGGTGPAVRATASAWATSNNNTGSRLQSATLRAWSGLSVQARGESAGNQPEHATDNNGKKESILFSFSRSIALTRVSMGWIDRDADFSLLRYTGTGTPTMAGSRYTGMVGNGWELVGNYLGNKRYNTNVNTGMASSSFWLVAAINGAFGRNDNKADHFKLRTIQGKIVRRPPPTGVPSPSTLPLLAISLLGLGFASRRRKQA